MTNNSGQLIVHIKEGLWGNIFAILFMLAIVGGAIWLNFRSGNDLNLLMVLWCLAMMLGCCFPINNILKPTEYILAIEGDALIWRIRKQEGAENTEKRVPLKSIQSLEFVLPRVVAVRKAKYHHLAQLFLVTRHKSRIEVPPEFYPGVYRKKIVATLQQYLPDLKVTERIDN